MQRLLVVSIHLRISATTLAPSISSCRQMPLPTMPPAPAVEQQCAVSTQ